MDSTPFDTPSRTHFPSKHDLQQQLSASDAKSETSDDVSDGGRIDKRLSIDIVGLLKSDHRFEEEENDSDSTFDLSGSGEDHAIDFADASVKLLRRDGDNVSHGNDWRSECLGPHAIPSLMTPPRLKKSAGLVSLPLGPRESQTIGSQKLDIVQAMERHEASMNEEKRISNTRSREITGERLPAWQHGAVDVSEDMPSWAAGSSAWGIVAKSAASRDSGAHSELFDEKQMHTTHNSARQQQSATFGAGMAGQGHHSPHSQASLARGQRWSAADSPIRDDDDSASLEWSPPSHGPSPGTATAPGAPGDGLEAALDEPPIPLAISPEGGGSFGPRDLGTMGDISPVRGSQPDTGTQDTRHSVTSPSSGNTQGTGGGGASGDFSQTSNSRTELEGGWEVPGSETQHQPASPAPGHLTASCSPRRHRVTPLRQRGPFVGSADGFSVCISAEGAAPRAQASGPRASHGIVLGEAAEADSPEAGPPHDAGPPGTLAPSAAEPDLQGEVTPAKPKPGGGSPRLSRPEVRSAGRPPRHGAQRHTPEVPRVSFTASLSPPDDDDDDDDDDGDVEAVGLRDVSRIAEEDMDATPAPVMDSPGGYVSSRDSRRSSSPGLGSSSSPGPGSLAGMSPEVQRMVRERHAKERFHEPLFGVAEGGDLAERATASCTAGVPLPLSPTAGKSPQDSRFGRADSTASVSDSKVVDHGGSEPPARMGSARGDHGEESPEGGVDGSGQDSGFGSDESVVRSLRFDSAPVTPPRRRRTRESRSIGAAEDSSSPARIQGGGPGPGARGPRPPQDLSPRAGSERPFEADTLQHVSFASSAPGPTGKGGGKPTPSWAGSSPRHPSQGGPSASQSPPAPDARFSDSRGSSIGVSVTVSESSASRGDASPEPWESLYWAAPRRSRLDLSAASSDLQRQRAREAEATPGHRVFSPAVVAIADARRSSSGGPPWEVAVLPRTPAHRPEYLDSAPGSAAAGWFGQPSGRRSTLSGGGGTAVQRSGLGVSLVPAERGSPGGGVLGESESRRGRGRRGGRERDKAAATQSPQQLFRSTWRASISRRSRDAMAGRVQERGAALVLHGAPLSESTGVRGAVVAAAAEDPGGPRFRHQLAASGSCEAAYLEAFHALGGTTRALGRTAGPSYLPAYGSRLGRTFGLVTGPVAGGASPASSVASREESALLRASRVSVPAVKSSWGLQRRPPTRFQDVSRSAGASSRAAPNGSRPRWGRAPEATLPVEDRFSAWESARAGAGPPGLGYRRGGVVPRSGASSSGDTTGVDKELAVPKSQSAAGAAGDMSDRFGRWASSLGAARGAVGPAAAAAGLGLGASAAPRLQDQGLKYRRQGGLSPAGMEHDRRAETGIQAVGAAGEQEGRWMPTYGEGLSLTDLH